jgi:antitoxin FitA
VAEIKVRQLEERVVDVLRVRAKHRGVSLEEEVRSILTAAVDADREALTREAKAISERVRRANPVQATDSVRIIREERDAWG